MDISLLLKDNPALSLLERKGTLLLSLLQVPFQLWSPALLLLAQGYGEWPCSPCCVSVCACICVHMCAYVYVQEDMSVTTAVFMESKKDDLKSQDHIKLCIHYKSTQRYS